MPVIIFLFALLGFSTAWADPQTTAFTADFTHGPYIAGFAGDVNICVNGTYDGTMTIETRPPIPGQDPTDNWSVVYTYTANEDVCKTVAVGTGQFRVELGSSTSASGTVWSWDVADSHMFSPEPP